MLLFKFKKSRMIELKIAATLVVAVQSLSHVWLSANSWTAAC